jgi:hypothetical protein
MNDKNDSFSDNLVAPDTYLLLAIFSTFVCFFPLGIFALINSIKVMSLWKKGYYEQARIASDNAIKYGQLAMIIGGIGWLLYFFLK